MSNIYTYLHIQLVSLSFLSTWFNHSSYIHEETLNYILWYINTTRPVLHIKQNQRHNQEQSYTKLLGIDKAHCKWTKHEFVNNTVHGNLLLIKYFQRQIVENWSNSHSIIQLLLFSWKAILSSSERSISLINILIQVSSLLSIFLHGVKLHFKGLGI